ncbi:MAG: Membrane protein [Pelotomaculum thermopropionicum]|uniref:Membrane protein n=1 Tax=Pelotomaculum thermopropionicum TaxID=110500 RepID=A0A101HQ25_9FIRM|nr:MAG: Membrane protein [Pelotomaculum thermopropionicum]
MKGKDFNSGGAVNQVDRISYYRQPHWKKPGWSSVNKNIFYRIGAALVIFIIFLALKETNNPWGVEAREKLEHILTTEWNYQPVAERIVQFGLQVAETEWPFDTKSRPVFSDAQNTGTSGILPFPVSGTVVRGYGMVLDPADNMERFHWGIDIAAPVGSGVKAVKNGKVKRTGDSPLLGDYILIEHEAGNFTLYGGLSEIIVVNGQEVQAGELIGKVGTSGDIPEGGLHFEVRENNQLVDPLTRLQVD